MFHSLGDQLKSRVGGTFRTASLLALVAFSCLVMVSFLCAAVFIVVLQNFGAVLACLAVAGIFLVIALSAAACNVQLKRRKRPTPALSGLATAMSDPTIAAAGVQIVRTVGVKRLLPLLAIGGIAFGLLAQRKAEDRQTNPHG
jgi:hypothetical protein